MQITRSDASMKLFYGTYAAISGLLVAICLSVDAAKDHRVLWLVVDIFAVAYVCLLNPWFRNHLVRFADYLTKLEKR
jgi:type III secretory pathway component EscS